MSIKIFVPIDSTALSLGANEVAEAISKEAQAKKLDIQIIRNSSRGLFWLETLVELETPQGRIGFGPINPSDVKSLFDADFINGGKHPLALGVVADIDWLKKQERLTFARMGITEPTNIDQYTAYDGFQGLKNALNLKPEAIVETVTASGLRGRGGAAFPTGIKWKTVLDTKATQKYIVCNADEGDSGTYSDRMIMEGDPFVLIEGMIIAGLAVGATQGYIYLRSEYPHALKTLNEAIHQATKAGYLGEDILKSGKVFHLEVRRAAGAYICGEES